MGSTTTMLVSSPTLLSLTPSRRLLKERIGCMRSRFTKTFGARGQGVPYKELEEANELLCSWNSVDS